MALISANLFFEYYTRLNLNLELNEIQVFENIKKANKKNKREFDLQLNEDKILLNISPKIGQSEADRASAPPVSRSRI